MPRKYIGLMVTLIIFVVAGFLYRWSLQHPLSTTNSFTTNSRLYNPDITPTDFGPEITNPYFILKPGTVFTYATKTSDGLERIKVEVTPERKQIMGVRTMTVRDLSWLNDVLVEDTLDQYAQHRDGSVWYFGEQVDNYKDGKLKDHTGSWEAGVDGAKPGIIMEAGPKVGDSYRQEYYQGKAEDMADVVALNQSVTVPHGTFTGCLKTRDWSQVETNLNEYKYYCPDVGFVVLEELAGGQERTELVGVTSL